MQNKSVLRHGRSVAFRQAMARERREVAVRGIVQGVGYRPFIYSLAHRYGPGGFVRNDAGGVQIEVEGNLENLELFLLKYRGGGAFTGGG